MKDILYILTTVLCLCSCGGKERKSYDSIGSGGLTDKTSGLAGNLRSHKEKGVMVGQMYGMLRGIGWEGDSARSDINSICNDMPACSGYELAGLESGGNANVDGVSADLIRRDILTLAHRQGLAIVFWTVPRPENDDQLREWTEGIARFLDSLQDGYGIKAPVVLIPMPLSSDRTWYARLTPEEYKDRYARITSLLRDDFGCTNAVWGYSCHATGSAGDYMTRFPDCDVVVADASLMADGSMTVGAYGKALSMAVAMLGEVSRQKGVATGMTTGYLHPSATGFWSRTVLSAITGSGLSYILFGENRGEAAGGSNYVPYPGGELVEDFVKFYNDSVTSFAHDINGLYLTR